MNGFGSRCLFVFCFISTGWAGGGLLAQQPGDLDALFMDPPPAGMAADVPSPPLVSPAPEPAPLPEPEGASLVPETVAIDDDAALLPYARSLSAVAGREGEAADAYEKIARSRKDPAFLREYAGVLTRAGRYDRAVEVYENLGRDRLPRDDLYTLIRALRGVGRSGEAAQILAELHPPTPGQGDPVWDLIQRKRSAGKLPEALQEVALLSARKPNDARLAKITADLAFETGNFDLAATALQRLVALEPSDPGIWTQHAGLLMAKRDFRGALDAYEKSLQLQPDDLAVRRQIFRIHGILDQPDLARAALEPVFEPSVDSLLAERLARSPAAENSASLQAWLRKHRRSNSPFALAEALQQAMATGRLSRDLDPETSAAVLLALESVQPEWSLQRTAWTELSASQAARSGQNLRAAQLYRRLSAEEADNLSALYGLAGSLRATGEVEEAIEVYSTIVGMNPDDPVAAGALQEAADLLRDQIEVVAAFQNEDSPGRLANITRLQMAALYSTHFGDRWTLRAGPVAWFEAPRDGPSYWAEGLAVEALYRLNEHLSFDFAFGYKGYNDPGIPHTFTGSALVRLQLTDAVRVVAGYERADVITNEFNILDGTQTNGLVGEVTVQPVRNLDVSLASRLLFYNDNNTQFIGNARLAYHILTKPGRLTASIGGIGMQTAYESREMFQNGVLDSIVYPYWTPQGYFQGYASLGWHQSLAPAAYAGQNEFSYGLQFVTSMDTTSNFLLGGEAYIRWEIIRNLILQAAGSIQRSKEWNGSQATLSLSYRF